MGKVWVGALQVGTFEPQTVGTTGNVYIGATDVGDFALSLTGDIFIGTTDVGNYWAYPTPEAPSDQDARQRTRVYLNFYLNPDNLSEDNDVTLASYAVIYANPNYSLIREFSDLGTDVLFCVGTPVTTALPVGVGYVEEVPITVWCINKAGITGTLLRWKGELELRRIVETFPIGSLRTLDRLRDNEQNLGSTVLYSVEYVLRYTRFST